MSSSGLTASSLKPALTFNWVFLIELLTCGVSTLFFLFYFNRLFATVVSFGLRAWTWHKYRVYIDIQALQISFLGGRIFFKGVRYHGNNETLFIHSGYVTWQYWLRKVREVDLKHGGPKVETRSSSDSDKPGTRRRSTVGATEEGGGNTANSNLPCRLSVSVKGVEWFVYNRSAAYDAIVAGMTRETETNVKDISPKNRETAEDTTRLRKRGKTSDNEKDITVESSLSGDSLSSIHPPLTEKSTFATEVTQTQSKTGSETTNQGKQGDVEGADQSMYLQFLPIYINCRNAAVVLGNENTRSVLITKVDRASGEIDATVSRPPDQYKQLINFKFEHPVVQIKPNDDFKEDQTDAAIRVKEGLSDEAAVEQPQHSHSFWYRRRRKAWHKLQDLVPYFRSSVESFDSDDREEPNTSREQRFSNAHQWQGLSRYLEEAERDDHAKWSAIEYATVTTIVDCPSASMCFYWDVPGNVPKRTNATQFAFTQTTDDINGDTPPEWGIDIIVKGAVINYGPWADRQRADLQRVFFPSLCKDATTAEKLQPGHTRVPTVFKLYLELEEEATLRVPIREESKNWKWKKQADTMGQDPTTQEHRQGKGTWRNRRSDKNKPTPEVRPFGWLDVRVGANTSITYVMDMVASTAGFSNKMELDLPSTEITTSVNHGLLWRSVGDKISCDLSNPLEWNGLRTWQFDIASKGLELFILREHVFLLIDLVNDWAGGPPPEFLTFCPFRYLVNLRFEDFRLYLNVNDSNIVNNPSDFDDNTFIIIFGALLTANLVIPLDRYRPLQNEISFDIEADTGGLNLHVPPWNTQATFLNSTEIARLDELMLHGKYQYNSTTSTANTDTLLLDVYGKAPSAQFYGFVIRYYLKIKDNYFGEDIHFKTLDEYQQLLEAKTKGEETELSATAPPKKSNDLDVVLSIASDDATVLLPSSLYTPKSHVRIDIANLSADLRFTNYYMDLQVNLSTLAFSLSGEHDGNSTPISAMSSTQLFVDGINVYGHRLFGLPPTEPTYVCNWDFNVGAITGECSTDFLGRLAAGARCFAFSFDDDENALPSVSEVVLKDVTFLRASVQPMKIWLHVDEAALLFSTDTITAEFDDWAASHFSQKLKAKIPNLVIACVDSESASRHRSRPQYPVETHAYFKTTIDLNQIGRKLDFEKERSLQQQHIRYHDRRTLRASFLLHDSTSAMDESSDYPSFDPPAMCFPSLPLPLESDKSVLENKSSVLSMSSGYASRTSSYRRKSSFLSAGSSIRSVGSVVRPHFGAPTIDTVTPLHSDLTPSPSRSRFKDLSRRGSSYPRDVSVSTGRGSSSYSVVADHDDRRGLPHSSVAFSSSYVSPYFPLESVEPDNQDVPVIPHHLLEDDEPAEDEIKLEDINPRRYDQSAVHSSLIIRTSDGIVGCFKPEAVRSISQLLESLQPHDPTDMIDDLHINAMENIFKQDKQKMISGKIDDMRICIPAMHIRFLNPAASQPTTSSRCENDQYDFQLMGFDATIRSKTSVGNKAIAATIKESSSAHLRLRSINLSAKERFDNVTSTQAAVYCGIDDFSFWIFNDNITKANMALNRIEVTTASNKIEYLASLLHRSNVLTEQLGDLFSAANDRQKRRLEAFIFRLTKAGHQASDPAFLTRPSYVLRSAQQHLRTRDSWKVISRLRYMYTSLDDSVRRALDMLSMTDPEECPVDAKNQVIGMLDQWRSWDMNHLDNCVVMKAVYGTRESVVEEPSSKPLDIDVHCGAIHFILDPGPKQNEIYLKSITIQVDADLNPRTAASQNSNSSVSEDDMESVATIQVYCVDVGTNLNWELCELIDDVMLLRLEHEQRSKPKSPIVMEHPEGPSTPSAFPQQIHVLVVTEKGSITVDTINVKMVSVSKGLKASITSTSHAGQRTANSVLLNAEAASTKIRSRSQELTLSQIRHPSIYVSHEQNSTQDFETNIFKITGNCQELSYVVRQDSLAVLEVINLVISDEVTQLHRLIESIPKKPMPVSPAYKAPISKPKSKNLINVALFLDMYHISVPLSQSLTYNISGVVARASVAARLDSGIIFDFDIKEHAHDIQTRNHDSNRSISLLQMPSTNGRITTRTSDHENEICAFVSIEPIELDASAIHSLLAAVNRPEIASVVSQMKEDIARLKDQIEEIFGGPETPRVTVAAEPSKQLVYRTHATLAGLNIFVNAPSTKSSSDSARVSLDFGRIHLEIANRLEENGALLPYPEVNIALRNVLFELIRVQNNRGERSGSLAFGAVLSASSKKNAVGEDIRAYHIKSEGLEINLFSDTAPTVLDIMAHLQDRIKDLDFSRERRYFRKLSRPPPRISISKADDESEESVDASTTLFASQYSLELLKIQISWIVATQPQDHADRENEDLVLSFERINLSTKKENSAKLTIEDLQLQMVPRSLGKSQRSQNSALLPEVVFNVGYVSNHDSRRLAFQVAGKSLDLRLTSQFIIPAAELQKSIGSAIDSVRAATATWTTPSSGDSPQVQRQPFFGGKRTGSLLVDADFAGAVVYLQGKKTRETAPGIIGIQTSRVPQEGRYGQFNRDDANSSTTLRAPGLAWKIEYSDNGVDEPSLNAEVKVDASSNTLYPTIVPLIMEISSAVKEMVSDDDPEEMPPAPKVAPQKFMTADEDNILTADPSAVLGKTRLNLGLRICRQEFSLSCQPIARVAATMRFDDIYMTVNTVRSVEQGNFFAISAAFTKLQASVQHVYSRESTGSFDVDTIVLSLMNSKHVSGTSGLSTILKISPMKILVNAKQLQDFLLFREIWVPPEIRQNSPAAPTPATSATQSQTFLVQRYQQVAATGAFPWNATVSIAELDVQLDLGQAIGKSAFIISNFWVSSKKNSDWEQNLCLGFDKVGVDSSGRMSGLVAWEDFKVRTTIQWPAREKALNQTPLVQGSLGFSQLRIKAAFDYQAFLVADITSFDFIMYNIRNSSGVGGDRLVATLDGDSVQVFCTSTSASQGLALYQAFLRLVQEKKTNYEASLKEIERFMKRKSVVSSSTLPQVGSPTSGTHESASKSPLSLQTDVVVTLKAVNIGAFPSTFFDHQVFKLEALDATARFAVAMDNGKIHSHLGLTLGQLRIGLAAVKGESLPKSLTEMSIEDVITNATTSRGGTILKVPQVQANMQTWHYPESNQIDYIFKSSFEGKVEVGWNYSRISFIRGMWASHSRALAHRLGKPLPPSAVKITGVPRPEEHEDERKDGEQQKITAEVNVPQSKYEYTALEPPIIETPQLRDMGEATPPLEWIGLHRERLPNLTHQIVIVSLLEVASEVEDAYAKILGSS